MNKPIVGLLVIALLFGGSYWYYTAFAGCDVPRTYRVGSIDERFDLTPDEARTAISTAESLWEDATDRNLFSYDEAGEITINFVYDERQERADEEAAFRETLEAREEVSDSVKEEYDLLLGQYEKLRASYTNAVTAYEARLTAHNAEVAEWNERGGAPKDVFERLAETEESLKKENRRLGSLTTQLNTLVRRLNQLGTQGNSIITDYNSLVHEYNNRFGEGDEFTQGDYEKDMINIYEFDTEEELSIVLAHELGHALGVEHVEGEASIMYHLMGSQQLEGGLSQTDIGAFEALCGEPKSLKDALTLGFDRMAKRLIN